MLESNTPSRGDTKKGVAAFEKVFPLKHPFLEYAMAEEGRRLRRVGACPERYEPCRIL
jgi:hypothetical protein